MLHYNNTTFFVMRDISKPNLSSNEENSQTKAKEAMFAVIAALSFLLNFLFCVTMTRKPAMLKRPHNILLFSLAITDLLTGLLKLEFVLDLVTISMPLSSVSSYSFMFIIYLCSQYLSIWW